MPTKTYNIFISHAWRYGDAYYRLEKLLFNAPYFQFKNYSVPAHNPKVDPDSPVGKRILLAELDKQIRPVHVVLVISGMYLLYSNWIIDEIRIAQHYGKPIIGIRPFGALKAPVIIQDAAEKVVRWNTNSIVDAIREFAI